MDDGDKNPGKFEVQPAICSRETCGEPGGNGWPAPMIILQPPHPTCIPPTHTHRIYRQTIGGVRLAFTSYCDFRDNRPQPLFSKSINWESFLMREIPRTLGRRCRLHFVGFLAPSASPIQWNTRFYSLQLCHWLFLLLPSPSPGRESRPLLTWLRFISTKGWLLTKACYKENHEIVFMMKDLPKGCCLFLKCC